METQLEDVRQQLVKAGDKEAIINAVHRSSAYIEFTLDGVVVAANELFLQTVGYRSEEVIGQHHRLFVDPTEHQSTEYQDFWQTLGRGEFHRGEFRRKHKSGEDIWLQAVYCPVIGPDGQAVRVVKLASNITEQKALQGTTQALLEEATNVMQSLATGDLEHRVDGEYSGAFGGLKEAINKTINKLAEIITSIHEVSLSVDGGANEISRGNLNLSQRTEQQAASLAQTSSNMEGMTRTVAENAENARTANTLAIAAQDRAEVGGKVVTEATRAMSDINDSSKKIGDIIGVIDEIAFQTNLLALNAAVEAARAGDHGRGFSVVASEVRSLAGRSATAAKEIKALIMDSGKKVEQGTLLVNQSGETLEEIVGGVKQVTEIVGQIAEASEQQATGISEVNDAVRHMDQLTQQNSALVEEAAASSETLSEQARGLGRLISFFTLETKTANAAPAQEAPFIAPPVERRADNRPWSGSSLATAGPIAAAAGSSHGAAASEDWEEF
ncbi:MAG: methyl-accepting chemotaxis protein [Gammaproteobacteria bacterium]